MTFLSILQVVIFTALLLNTVHLMPAFGRCLRNAESLLRSGYLGAMLTIRLARNALGLILVTASTAPDPNIHALVPKGILLFLVLAVVNVLLTHYRQREDIEGIRF
ncbi:hypothetical protein QQF73_13860 [Marinobacter sp. M216]|uniref:Uncharacterized protein n=1 Tax=Marinobacter albus TaxID=3030833 RepID=A0ABT7HGV6_9GAMM|nr:MULTISPECIES: hypothetical protein [unclassified Marinobacter]MBW7472145.1 hypothetical protein [Marinobacter sp. F4218]MDK9558715.1 hypothetical protein [Marinobacter sp. M216]